MLQTRPTLKIEGYPAGEAITDPQPGDFLLLSEGDDFFCKMIRFGQALRFRGNDARYARFNHAALFVNTSGAIIEALSEGVRRTNVAKYLAKDYVVVRVKASDADRMEACCFAQSRLNDGYGWLTIASIILSVLTTIKISFGDDRQDICSGLVARALERTSAIFPRDASHMMPADLAKFYGVE